MKKRKKGFKEKEAESILPKSILLMLINFIVMIFCACAHNNHCMTQDANRTFVQIWRQDAKRTPEQWDQWFQEIHRLGFSEIIVQWSAYGRVSFHRDQRTDQESSPSLDAFIQAAQRHKKRVWLGLDYDPDFWQAISGSPDTVQKYLHHRLQQISQRLPLLLQSVEKNDPQGQIVKGWYISDEIDDLNWQAPSRQKVLWAYLANLRKKLWQARTAWPTLISGFSNGVWPPEQLATFWNETLKRTKIDGFLFQDGIGADKMTFKRLETYLRFFQANINDADRHFGVIVEIFQVKNNNSNASTNLQAADMTRVSQQLALARQYSTQPITIFAAPDYLKLDGDANCRELYKVWRNDSAMCQ